jgi:ribosomal protein S17E
MPLKNTQLFTKLKSEGLPGILYRSRFVIALLLAVLLLLASCKKIEAAIEEKNQNLLQEYFEANILNKDFTVRLATDSSNNITNQFAGYRFKLTKSTLTNGAMTATFGTTVFTGDWSANEDYSKLVITLPNTITSFSFLTREWKFTKKAIPVMELAPWGTTDPKVLHMERL